MPVGAPFLTQNLMLVEKDGQERVHTRVSPARPLRAADRRH